MMCTVERTSILHPGSAAMPPLVQVPGGDLLLEAVVKPPDVDALAQWERSARGNADADSSWGSVWPGAVNLAAFIAEHPTLVKFLRVAELGSGLGVPGLTAAKVGASTVTLIDREAFALHCAMSTAVVCGLQTGPCPGTDEAEAFYVDAALKGVVSASMSDWGALSGSSLEVDVVLASEILYEDDPTIPKAVAHAAAALLKSGGTLLLADPADGRGGSSSARDAVSEALRDLGASVSERPISAPPAGDAWYSLRAGDGTASVAAPSEAVMLLRADFDGPPKLQ